MIKERSAKLSNEDGYVAHLFKNDQLFGTIDIKDKSIHYANDVVENWENGILREDNEHIKKFNQSS
tara:strand:+ start:15676 stop:15873 length:198 start_codon:yes stop_codon:yes gene_type:complete